MVVNGKIWPRAEVEPRKYRLRLLNGCDSRFLVVKFLVLQEGSESWPMDFDVIGGDQGLADYAKTMNQVVMSPAMRLDVIVDFAALEGRQILLFNTGGDEPFGGDIPGPQVFTHTDKIMRFDVTLPLNESVQDDYEFATTSNPVIGPQVTRTRRLGLFEGMDQYGRLQPLLGTVDPAYDRNYNPIYYPDEPMYSDAGIHHQQAVGTMTWHTLTTENMHLNDVEEWEIWNLSADAHPIHL
jgi:spore coat protein A, manganese oxidase